MTISVTQLGNFLKAMVDSEVLLYDLQVEGEVSNYRQSGEVVFFVLKDQNAQIDCFCYNPPKTKIAEGQQVIVFGKPNFYVKGGKLSFLATKIQTKDTVGDQFKQLLLLKEKLEKQGLFDALRKKPINSNCKKIGVITSSEGAVIQDIKNVSHRRNPTVDIIVYDCRVQGINSEFGVIKGLKYFENTDVDNVIIARGGGSSEDLSSFNSEALVYAIADCKKPVISAVGHETDFTLCDFVADCRASTPSVAAELSTQNIQGVIDDIKSRFNSQKFFISSIINNQQTFLQNTKSILFTQLSSKLQNNQNAIEGVQKSLLTEIKYILSQKQNEIEKIIQKFDDNNPAKILQKGFVSIKRNNIQICSAKDLKSNDEVELTFCDGKANAKILDIKVKP